MRTLLLVGNMDWLHHLLLRLSLYSLEHLQILSFALMTSVVALYGHRLNRRIQRQIRKYHLAIRTTAFVLICAFGYGWLGARLAGWLELGLRNMPRYLLPPTIISLFICLGLLAQRERQI